MNGSEYGNWLFDDKKPEFRLYGDIEEHIFNVSKDSIEDTLSFINSLKDIHKTYAVECIFHAKQVKIAKEDQYKILLDRIGETFEIQNNEDDDTFYPDEDLKWIYSIPKDKQEENQFKEAIQNDDKEKLIFLTADERYSDKTISGHSLIEFACLCGAVECFKYLLTCGCSVSGCEKAAVYGGNEEICQICSTNSCSFDNCLLTAVKAHQNDIAQWILDNCTIDEKIDANEKDSFYNIFYLSRNIICICARHCKYSI